VSHNFKNNDMEERTLKWLDIHEMKVLKQIIIISDRQNGETEIGRILYTRPLTTEYNFIKQQAEEESLGEKNKFERLFQEYPKQANYPNDRIDEIIFNAVKRAYPKSVLRNDSILFNVDLEKIELLKNRNIIKSAIYFSPEFSMVENFYDYVGKEFQAPRISINIYSYYRPDFLEGQIFYANFDVSESNVIEKLETVHFE
ncbi:MAG: hypothetical protein KGZ81_12370, partial [Flavobacteriales bacterium]|nr:hypothetical protein [Flavobacteriales bacterium]